MSTLSPIQSPLRSQALRDRVDALARRLGPGAKMPPTAELCREMGVSPNTLSRVLGELEGEGLLVRRRPVGVFVSESLARRKTNIAMICHPNCLDSPSRSPFWEQLLEEAHRRADEHGELLQMHFCLKNGALPDALQNNVREANSSGALHGILGIGLSQSSADWLENLGVPLVNLFGPARHTVLIDVWASLEIAIDLLVEKGCRKIAFWWSLRPGTAFDGDVVEFSLARERRAVAAQKLAAHGIEAPHLWWDSIDLLGEHSPHLLLSYAEQGFQAARDTFCGPRHQWPDAIVCLEEQMTRGALHEMERLEIRPGRDCRLVSHANENIELLGSHQKQLALLESSAGELVKLVFDRLEAVMNGLDPQPHWVKVVPTLRIGEKF